MAAQLLHDRQPRAIGMAGDDRRCTRWSIACCCCSRRATRRCPTAPEPGLVAVDLTAPPPPPPPPPDDVEQGAAAPPSRGRDRSARRRLRRPRPLARPTPAEVAVDPGLGQASGLGAAAGRGRGAGRRGQRQRRGRWRQRARRRPRHSAAAHRGRADQRRLPPRPPARGRGGHGRGQLPRAHRRPRRPLHGARARAATRCSTGDLPADRAALPLPPGARRSGRPVDWTIRTEYTWTRGRSTSHATGSASSRRLVRRDPALGRSSMVTGGTEPMSPRLAPGRPIRVPEERGAAPMALLRRSIMKRPSFRFWRQRRFRSPPAHRPRRQHAGDGRHRRRDRRGRRRGRGRDRRRRPADRRGDRRGRRRPRGRGLGRPQQRRPGRRLRLQRPVLRRRAGRLPERLGARALRSVDARRRGDRRGRRRGGGRAARAR